MFKKIIKLSIIIICCLGIIFLVLFLCYGKDFIRTFKKKESLNYHDIRGIQVNRINNGTGTIQIEDKDDIERILSYLNSLELIREKIPKNESPDYDGDIDKYLSKFDNIGFFTISLYGSTSDGIAFTTEYLTVYHNGYDWDYTSYYIVDSGYNPEDNSSKFYDFMVELISKYVEE